MLNSLTSVLDSMRSEKGVSRPQLDRLKNACGNALDFKVTIIISITKKLLLLFLNFCYFLLLNYNFAKFTEFP